jgi:hypothetical protein
MRIIINIPIGPGRHALALLLGLLPAVPLAAASEPPLAVEARLDAPPPGGAPEHGKAFTGDATPVEPGRVEVEVAYAPSWWATAGAVDRLGGDQHQMAAAVGVGLLRDVDARLVVGWSLVHAVPEAPGAPTSGSGLTDTTVAARWRFLSIAEPAIDLAVSAAVTIPTGTRAGPDHLGTGGESFGLGGSITASADLGPVTAGLELGFSAPLRAAGSSDVGLLSCNAAVGYQVLPWLQPELELNYQHEIELGEERDERVLWATAALVVPLDAVRVLAGARFPVWSRDAAVGPMATAAVKLAF